MAHLLLVSIVGTVDECESARYTPSLVIVEIVKKATAVGSRCGGQNVLKRAIRSPHEVGIDVS